AARTRTLEAGAPGSSLVDQGPTRQVEEDVLERGAAHEHAVRLETELVHVRGGRVAVVRVEQQAVRERFEPAHEAVQARGELGRDFLRTVLRAETKLDHLARGKTADELEGRALGGDLALVHDDEPVAELLGLV